MLDQLFTSVSFLAAGASNVAPVFAVLSMVLGAAVIVSLIFHRFRQSFLTGYLLCGLLIANSGVLDLLNLEDAERVIDSLADWYRDLPGSIGGGGDCAASCFNSRGERRGGEHDRRSFTGTFEGDFVLVFRLVDDAIHRAADLAIG